GDAEHGKDRLIQDQPGDVLPKPRRLGFHPGLKRRLTGLMDVVPELAEAGEAQGLVGDEARAVIDNEDESAGQEQQADKPEQTADHASPNPCRAREGRLPYRQRGGNSTSSAAYRPFLAAFRRLQGTR